MASLLVSFFWGRENPPLPWLCQASSSDLFPFPRPALGPLPIAGPARANPMMDLDSFDSRPGAGRILFGTKLRFFFF